MREEIVLFLIDRGKYLLQLISIIINKLPVLSMLYICLLLLEFILSVDCIVFLCALQDTAA
jgi:hypothetical protein